MNLLDLVLLVLAVVAAVGGYRLGFLARGASWLGLVAGILVGVWAVPMVLRLFTAGDPLTRMLVGIGTLLAAVTILTSVGESIGLRLRRRVHGTALRPLDQTVGAVAGLAAIGLLVWFLAPAAAEVPGAVSQQVRSSSVVRFVSEASPEPPNTVQALRNLVGRSRFPQVFADLRPAPDTGPPPSEIPVPPDVVARVTASTVNVEVDACGGRFEGSGWTVATDRVVTNAHVVAGADVVQVRRPDGQLREGRVIAFDGGLDLALLAIPDLGQQPLPMAVAEVGSDGATIGYPGGQDQPRTEPVTVRDRRNTIGRDIYGREPAERELLFLAANLRQGDSGSAVIDVQGRVTGTVFAVSPDRASTAYALDTAEVQRFLDGPRSEGRGALRVSAPELSRREALAVLSLPPGADDEAVKRAYRRLARELHPDAGGDVAAFRELQRAYERLLATPEGSRERRTPHRARPSRRTRAGDAPTQLWSDQAVDVDAIDWDGRVGPGGLTPLDVDVVARALVRPSGGPVRPLTARSRGPRSLLNRWLHLMADDLTATLQVRPARTRGRQGHDVEVWIRVWARGARRLVDAATLPDDWVRQRGSSSTTLIRTIAPSPDRRVTAVRTARIVEDGLAAAGWPLASWYAPADELV